MSATPTDELELLRAMRNAGPPPPPSAELRASIERAKPVRTRVPWHTLLVVLAAACAYPVSAVALYPLRQDLSALPMAWLIAVAVVWLGGFAIPLILALLPRRRQVLPDATRAARVACLAALTLVLMGLFFTIDAPGVTILPKTRWAGFLPLWWHCVSFSLKATVPALLVASIALRRMTVVNLSYLGAAVGAAGGALSGLTLHGLCPFGGGLHVGLAHGGGVVIGAALGALWLPLLARVSRDGGDPAS
jgi:hypothetical protein